MNAARTESNMHRRRLLNVALCCLLAALSAVFTGCRTHSIKCYCPDPPLPPESFVQEVPAAAFQFEMRLVPGDQSEIEPFYIGKTEMTWEAFDVFVYALDEFEESPPEVDAITRPTKPYLPPDRGFGHEGYAVISVSHHMATEFCKWLSAKSGRKYRLPTEAEWEYACKADDPAGFIDFYWGENDYGYSAGRNLNELAWYADNSDGTPHPVATKLPNDFGLHDMHGNVAEWVNGRDGQPVLKGGSYRDAADKLKISARAPFDPAWNASDPQIPKSQWWLADGPFVGFRAVCEVEQPTNQKENERSE